MSLSIDELYNMQKALYEHYGEAYHWDAYIPDNAKLYWLWMLGEAGEVIDVFKKNSQEDLLRSGSLREHMVEEFADTMMFFINTMACMQITPEEFSAAYTKKYEYNMHRWEKKANT